MMTPQQRAAKTRAFNRDSKRLYEEWTKPAHEKVEKVLNRLLQTNKVTLRFVGNWPLKKGVTRGRLLSIEFGGLSLNVLPNGYKHPRRYAASFWEAV
jgi:hypothetical protein